MQFSATQCENKKRINILLSVVLPSKPFRFQPIYRCRGNSLRISGQKISNISIEISTQNFKMCFQIVLLLGDWHREDLHIIIPLLKKGWQIQTAPHVSIVNGRILTDGKYRVYKTYAFLKNRNIFTCISRSPPYSTQTMVTITRDEYEYKYTFGVVAGRYYERHPNYHKSIFE